MLRYPQVENGKRFLNSGLFMGFAPELYQLVTAYPFPPEGNDQQYFSQLYIDEEFRRKIGFKLDNQCTVFQTIEGSQNDIEIRYTGNQTRPDGLPSMSWIILGYVFQ